MYITLKYYTTTLLTQPEGSNSISKFWKSLKMGKGQRAYRPHKLCYAMLISLQPEDYTSIVNNERLFTNVINKAQTTEPGKGAT